MSEDRFLERWSRRKQDSRWVDVAWRGVAVLPDEPETRPWTVLREE